MIAFLWWLVVRSFSSGSRPQHFTFPVFLLFIAIADSMLSEDTQQPSETEYQRVPDEESCVTKIVEVNKDSLDQLL